MLSLQALSLHLKNVIASSVIAPFKKMLSPQALSLHLKKILSLQALSLHLKNVIASSVIAPLKKRFLLFQTYTRRYIIYRDTYISSVKMIGKQHENSCDYI